MPLSPHNPPDIFLVMIKDFLVRKEFFQNFETDQKSVRGGQDQRAGRGQVPKGPAPAKNDLFMFQSFFQMAVLKAGAGTCKSLLNRLEDIFL